MAFGEPCAGKPLARFDEGATGFTPALYSTAGKNTGFGYVLLADHAAGTPPAFQVDFRSPTADKPQSKLWFAHDRWWALLPRAAGPSLWERTPTGWREHPETAAALTGLPGRADVWYDAEGATAASVAGRTLAVFRVQPEDASATRWAGRKLAAWTVPGDAPIETVTLARDGGGRWWLAATVDRRVLAWDSADGIQWSEQTPLETGIGADDICAIARLREGVGVIWSDQARDRVVLRLHRDAAAPATWEQPEVVVSGGHRADDHLHTAVFADGTLLVASKNSVDTDGQPQLEFYVRAPDGRWRDYPYAPRIGEIQPSRPIVLALPDGASALVGHTVYDHGRKPYVNDRIVFGRLNLATSGLLVSPETVIAPAAGLGAQVNDVTGTKQTLPADRPWLVLASDAQGRVYEADLSSSNVPPSLP